MSVGSAVSEATMGAVEWAPGLCLRGERPRLADYRFAAFDMDSTLIAIECIDEIAALAGRGEQVAAITEAAMRGEISDFRESLARRLALLAGQPLSLLDRVLRERLRFNPGAHELCAALKAAGLKLGLVSGGFTHFTRHVAAELGMDFVRANELEVRDGHLTGRAQAFGRLGVAGRGRERVARCAERVRQRGERHAQREAGGGDARRGAARWSARRSRLGGWG